MQRVLPFVYSIFNVRYKTGRNYRVLSLNFFGTVILCFNFFNVSKGSPFQFSDILQQTGFSKTRKGPPLTSLKTLRFLSLKYSADISCSRLVYRFILLYSDSCWTVTNSDTSNLVDNGSLFVVKYFLHFFLNHLLDVSVSLLVAFYLMRALHLVSIGSFLKSASFSKCNCCFSTFAFSVEIIRAVLMYFLFGKNI